MPGENETPDTTIETPPNGSTTPPDTSQRGQRGEFMPTATIGKIKKEAREKGERAAKEAMEQAARNAGYASHEEMVRAAADAKKRGAAAPQRQEPQRPQGNGSNGTGPSRRDFERLNGEVAQLQERVKVLQKENSRLAKRLREADREHVQKVATMELQFTALKAGIKPKLVPAAVALLREQIPARNDGEDEKAYYDRLKGFDEEKAFASMREEHGYLFGPAVQDAPKPPTTGNGSGVQQGKGPGNPPPTPPKTPEGNGGGTNGKSAKDMTTKEVRDRLSEMGLDPTVMD